MKISKSLVVAYVIGPAYLFGAILLCFGLDIYGVTPESIFIISTGTMIVVTLLLEMSFPYQKSWRTPDDQFANEIGHNIISSYIGHSLGEALARSFVIAAFVWLHTKNAAPWWPTSLPIWVQVCVALLVWEFGTYWHHRLTHRIRSFWRIHALHHKLRRLSCVNAGYGHPLDYFFQNLIATPIVFLAGPPSDVLLYSIYLTTAINFLSHANIDARMGVLNYVFVTPEVHRWHHAKEQVGRGCNFGIGLVFWDIVFGSYYLPKDKPSPTIIGSGTPMPAGFFSQLAAPFNWTYFSSKNFSPQIKDQATAYFRKKRTGDPSLPTNAPVLCQVERASNLQRNSSEP